MWCQTRHSCNTSNKNGDLSSLLPLLISQLREGIDNLHLILVEKTATKAKQHKQVWGCKSVSVCVFASFSKFWMDSGACDIRKEGPSIELRISCFFGPRVRNKDMAKVWMSFLESHCASDLIKGQYLGSSRRGKRNCSCQFQAIIDVTFRQSQAIKDHPCDSQPFIKASFSSFMPWQFSAYLSSMRLCDSDT